MSVPTFDAEQYKAGQRQQWDSVAQGWRKWWATIEKVSRNVNDRLMALAGVGAGHQVLDIATGIGEPALTAAKIVGAAGKVVATDQSDGMLQIARERAAEAELENIEFVVVDAGGLDFGEGAFDAATCRWGLMFMPDIEAALEKIHRSLKPDGRFVAAVWGPPEKVVGLSLAMGVVQKMLNLPPPPPEAPGMFKLGAPGAVEALLSGAGFGDVRTEALIVNFEFDSITDYVSFLRDIAAPIRAMLTQETPERQAEVWQAIGAAAGSYVNAGGQVSLPNETIIVYGQR